MKYFLIAILFLSFSFPMMSGYATHKPEPRPIKDICELYGAVYVEEVAAFANYKVFVEEIESFADFVVFREDTEAFANEPGHWFFTDVKGFANFTIFVEPVKGFADFSVAYTDFRTAVGCR
ncbi:MAG: hypothetical protein R3D00_07310 [Bacteroidia bacterium]